MNLNTIKPQLKPKALDGGLSEFYASLKEKNPEGENLTYIKNTPCILGCTSIIRKLIKLLSMQPGALSNVKPKVFAPTVLNKIILDPIVTKEGLDWNVQKIKNTKKDMNANCAVSLYNVNRKLSLLVAYDLTLDNKALEKYLQYINTELEYLDNIINKLGGEKSTTSVLGLNDKPSDVIVSTNETRRNKVKEVFNIPLGGNEEERIENKKQKKKKIKNIEEDLPPEDI